MRDNTRCFFSSVLSARAERGRVRMLFFMFLPSRPCSPAGDPFIRKEVPTLTAATPHEGLKGAMLGSMSSIAHPRSSLFDDDVGLEEKEQLETFPQPVATSDLLDSPPQRVVSRSVLKGHAAWHQSCGLRMLLCCFCFNRRADTALPGFVFCAVAEPSSVLGTIQRRARIISGDSN